MKDQYDSRYWYERAKNASASAALIRAKADLTADDEANAANFENTEAVCVARAQDFATNEMAEMRTAIGEGHLLTSPEDRAELDAFKNYMHTGDVHEISNTALSTSGADGGYVVPESLHAPLIEKVRLIDPLFAAAEQIDISGGNTTLELPYKSSHGVAAWAGEEAARSEQTEPGFQSASAVAYDLYSDQRATQTVIDSLPNFDTTMAGWLYGDVYEALGTALAVGNNTGQPCGVFTAAAGFTSFFSGSAASVLNSSPAKLYFGLNPKYLPNAAFYMASPTLAVLCGFASPSNSNIPLVDQTGDNFTLMGKPIRITDNAPALGAGTVPIVFGDMRQGLVIVTHRRPGILVDPFTASPLVRYSVLARIGACPYDKQAVVQLRCATV